MRVKHFLFAALIALVAQTTTLHAEGSILFQESVATSLDVGAWNKQMAAQPGRILDVRTESEYEDGHIRGAILCDVTKDSFKEDLAALELNKKMPVYVYCRSGGRSKQAMDILKAEGYQLIYDLDSGITGWEKAGLEVTE